MQNLIPATALTEIDDEPRIRDISLAERLNFSRPADIRELISRNRDELEAYGSFPCRTENPGNLGGRPSKAYYLNEGQALVLCALSRTPKAAEVRKLLINVFTAWRQGKLVDVKAHYRRPPREKWNVLRFRMTSHDNETAHVELSLPLSQALALVETLRLAG